MVRWVTTGNALFTKATTLAGRDATGWRPLGSKVAFWGMPPAGSMTTDPPLRLRRLGAQAQLGRAVLEGGSHQALVVARRDADRLRVCAASRPRNDVATLWTVDPAVATSAAQLGAGSLPAWLP